jgi:hypothetical protein
MRTRIDLAILALCLSSACATTKPTRTAVLHLRAGPDGTFESAHRVRMQAIGPDGATHEVTGTIERGGTTRALASSIVASLKRNGCAARFADAIPGPDGLARAMDQLVILPDGWNVSLPVAVEAHSQAEAQGPTAGWAASSQLTVDDGVGMGSAGR